MKIISIEDAGVKHTWDIEVLPSHYYLLSNGCVSHNTLSLLAGCSSSIEPIFAKEYTKTVMDGVKLDLSKHKDVSSDILVTAHEISIERHIAMQSAFQAHVDNAVSKTINLPKTAKVATVAKAFIDAHAQGCKGITVYREGSREGPMAIVNDKNALSECNGDKCAL